MRIRPLRAALALVASVALLAFASGAPSARAGGPDDPPKGRPKPDSPEEAVAKARALEADATRAFAEKRYEDAAKICREQIALVPESENARYNLACALSRLGKTKEALESLKAAVDRGFSDADHMREDEDLANLAGEKEFGELVAAARVAEAKAEETAYEPGAEIEGVKSVEGRPANGLRWRLRIGRDATAEKPHRLVVWLHPSGGSMNAKVEPLSKDLAAKGFALLVVTAKGWRNWNERDQQRLVDGTLPDVGKVEGVDAKRPVLLGFSAGGQLALVLWAKDPARWGGLVLDAAYPIDTAAWTRGARGPDAMLALPEGTAKKGTPVFVLVGEADQGQMAWRFAEEPWRTAGIPLTVTYVPDGKHEWLFGKEQLASLFAWLSDVAAGKLPGGAVADPKPPK